MLAKTNRLKKKLDFERVKKQGRLFRGSLFSLAIFDRGDEDFCRFGFVISTKTLALAVQRNRVKRLLSEAINLNLPKIKKGFDFVLIIGRGCEKQNFAFFKSEINRIFQENKLFV